MFAFIEATAATTAKSTPQIDSDGFTLDNRRRKRAQKTRQHFNYSALSIAGEDSPICDIERSIALVRQRIKLARFDTIISMQYLMKLIYLILKY
jgi:hypothetical protein